MRDEIVMQHHVGAFTKLAAFTVNSSGSPGPRLSDRLSFHTASPFTCASRAAIALKAARLASDFNSSSFCSGASPLLTPHASLLPSSFNPVGISGSELLLQSLAQSLREGGLWPEVEIAICKSPRLTTAG